jgi:hypothetical protein
MEGKGEQPFLFPIQEMGVKTPCYVFFDGVLYFLVSYKISIFSFC